MEGSNLTTRIEENFKTNRWWDDDERSRMV